VERAVERERACILLEEKRIGSPLRAPASGAALAGAYKTALGATS
jgi:hypothetical protein